MRERQNMVTGVKISTTRKSPHHSALATRKSPTQTHPFRKNSTPRWNRARYYHAELGRFISRDPIGYVDGMNLYRAYFVPTYVDPTGQLMRHDKPTIPIPKPAKKKKRTLCGNLSFTCSDGKTYSWPVYGDSDRAGDIIGRGCVTFVGPSRIECTGSCKAIKSWESAGKVGLLILDHEACHACAYEQCGFWFYMKTAVWDNCDKYPVSSTPIW